ncbi:TIGR03032 family protein [Ancylobacter lacus]|uniref:TIGR03032 family protein n=1 Tax=Ancylobacter lacus TaxID=2579970 RepID=UPI001BCAD498|nr:TIGR03032 family protein [Ancylobacter lacus]
MNQTADSHAPPVPDMPDIACSRGFGTWLASHQVSLALSSYQAGQLFLIGRLPDGRISFFRRDFERAMGLWYEADRLYLASMVQIWRLENVLAPGEMANDHFDRLFVARQANITGDVDAHEIAVEAGGRVVFVNTRHSCLATFSERHSFRPLWKPSFISRLAAEDRCHLNGLATESGHVRYVTCCARTDAVDGWRDRRIGSGMVIRVEDNAVVADGFTMPHSPRLYRGRLYVLDSGRGYLVRVDPATGAREDIAFCPGFLRGLSFHDGHALVTLSLPRYSTFAGLPLDEELTRRGVNPRCGIMIVNLANGDVVEWLTCDTVIRELFDVVAIPGAACPMVAPIRGPDFANLLTIEAPERCTDRWQS